MLIDDDQMIFLIIIIFLPTIDSLIRREMNVRVKSWKYSVSDQTSHSIVLLWAFSLSKVHITVSTVRWTSAKKQWLSATDKEKSYYDRDETIVKECRFRFPSVSSTRNYFEHLHIYHSMLSKNPPIDSSTFSFWPKYRYSRSLFSHSTILFKTRHRRRWESFRICLILIRWKESLSKCQMKVALSQTNIRELSSSNRTDGERRKFGVRKHRCCYYSAIRRNTRWLNLFLQIIDVRFYWTQRRADQSMWPLSSRKTIELF